MAVGVSVKVEGARPLMPRDRCSYPRPFSPDFTACPAYQATTFIAADSDDRERHTHLTCRHLEIGTDLAQAGRFYPRCTLGDPGQRRRWVARVGLERLEVVRTLQQEFDRFIDPHRERLYQLRERLRAEPTDWQLRDEMDRTLAEYRQAITRFLQEREGRFRDAGLTIGPLQELIEGSLATWARHLLSRPPRLDAARLRAYSPEAQAFLGTAQDASWKREASTAEVVFDDGMLEIARAGDPPRLMISGEMDVSNADVVAGALARESAGRDEVSIDLSGVLFSDLAGLRALLDAAGRLSGRSRLRLRGMPDQLRRTLELAGFKLPANLVVEAPEACS
jgi:anti-anti-sigma factor